LEATFFSSFFDKIALPFKLKEYQNLAVNAFIKKRHGTVTFPTGMGKCHRKGQLVVMFDGELRRVEDVKVNDLLMGPDSYPRAVKSISCGKGKMVMVKPERGDCFVVNDEHVLTLLDYSTNSQTPCVVDVPVKAFTTGSMWLKTDLKLFHVAIRFCGDPILPVDPYVFGLHLTTLLSVVDSRSKNKSKKDLETVRFFREKMPTQSFMYEKTIPKIYRVASRTNRLRLLAGLIDSNASSFLSTADTTCFQIKVNHEQLAQNIAFVARSVGLFASVFPYKKHFSVQVEGNIAEIPFKKIVNLQTPVCLNHNVLHQSFSLRYLKDEEEYYGFTLSGDGRYLLGDFTVTHNSAIAIEAARRVKLPTAIIVPTTALLNEWVRKLSQCGVYPGVFYGEEKRLSELTIFVINSAASYLSVLNRFSFIVIDEAHHVGAPEFSKIIDVAKHKPFLLCLSAHIQRSDEQEDLILKAAPLIFKMKIASAMKHKYVAGLRLFMVQSKMTGLERKLYGKYSDTIRNTFFQLHTTNASVLSKMENNPLALACLSAMVRRKILLSNIEDKKVKAKKIIGLCKNQRVLIFSEGIEGINAVYEYLKAKDISCGIYHSQIDSQQRQLMLQQWRMGQIQVLCAVKCLDEGIDVPDCRIGIIIATGTSSKQLIQRVGRIIRKRPDGSKGLLFIVYCPGTIESNYATRILHLIKNE